MSDTKTEVQRYAELAVEEASNLNSIARGTQPDPQWAKDSGLNGEFVDNEFDLGEALNNNALEVYANARITPDGSEDIRGVVVVLGTGGPHYEFEIDYQGNVEGRAFKTWARAR